MLRTLSTLFSLPAPLQDAMDSLQSESEQVRAHGDAEGRLLYVPQAAEVAVLRLVPLQLHYYGFALASANCFSPLHPVHRLPGAAQDHAVLPLAAANCFVPVLSSYLPQARALREIRSRDPAFDMVTFLRNLKHDVRTLIKVRFLPGELLQTVAVVTFCAT